jgi:hypothetical protein
MSDQVDAVELLIKFKEKHDNESWDVSFQSQNGKFYCTITEKVEREAFLPYSMQPLLYDGTSIRHETVYLNFYGEGNTPQDAVKTAIEQYEIAHD